MANHTVTPIASEAAFNTTIATLPPSCLRVLYFQTAWAEPCKQMSTILSTLASTYPLTASVAFISIDADEAPEISESYNVTQVPFIVLERDGKVLESVSGSDAARVRDAIETFLDGASNANGLLPPAQAVTRPAGPTAPEASPAGPATTSKAEVPGTESQETLNARLVTLVKAAPVMLFMKGTPSAPQCGFSRQTVALLRERGVRYGFFNILADDNVRQGLKTFSDWPTFPQVYVEGELIGGLDILKEEFENDPAFLAQHSVKADGSA